MFVYAIYKLYVCLGEYLENMSLIRTRFYWIVDYCVLFIVLNRNILNGHEYGTTDESKIQNVCQKRCSFGRQ